MRVRMSCYRSRRSGADDPNAKRVEFGRATVWFSYTTPVAFQVDGRPRVVRVNDWSVTTGAHLNAIDGGNRAARVPGDDFVKQLEGVLGRTFLPLLEDLTPDTPAAIVADWLEDRGMSAAAKAVRDAEMVPA